MSLDPTSAGSTPSSIPATQPITASPLAPAGAPTKTSPPKTDPTELRSGMTSPPIDPSQLNNTPAPIPIPSTEHISSDNTPTSPPLRSPEASTSAYMDTGIPLEPASHPTVAETGNLARSPSQSGPGPKSGQLERKERKQGEGIIKLGSFGGEGLVAKPVPGLKMGDEEAIE